MAEDRRALRREVAKLEDKQKFHDTNVAVAQQALADAQAAAATVAAALTAARENLDAATQPRLVAIAAADSRHPMDVAPEKRIKRIVKSPLGDRVEWELIPGERREMVAGQPTAVPKSNEPVPASKETA